MARNRSRISVKDRCIGPEGATEDSRGQRPRYTVRFQADPEGVALLLGRFDPFRVALSYRSISGGVAPERSLTLARKNYCVSAEGP